MKDLQIYVIAVVLTLSVGFTIWVLIDWYRRKKKWERNHLYGYFDVDTVKQAEGEGPLERGSYEWGKISKAIKETVDGAVNSEGEVFESSLEIIEGENKEDTGIPMGVLRTKPAAGVGKTVEAEPELELTYNQRSALRILQQGRSMQEFNIYCNTSLTVKEKDEVMDLVNTNEYHLAGIS